MQRHGLRLTVLLLLPAAFTVQPTLGRPTVPATSPAFTIAREDDHSFPGQSNWVLGQSYASLRDNELVRAVGWGDKCVLLRSSDGGKTWSQQEIISQDTPVDASHTRTSSLATFYLDPDNGLLVRFLGEVLGKTASSEIAYGSAVGYGPHTGRVFYQISRDGGHAWEAPQQLIETSGRYNGRHWARDTWYGRSALVIEGQTIRKLCDGTMVLPAYLWPTERYMKKLFDEQHWPENLRRDSPYFIESRCLVLRWRPDLSGLEMTSRGPIRLPGGYTTAGTLGSDEAALACLDNRHWFTVLRTGTGHVEEFQSKGLPALRYCAETTDGGLTWKARPLQFDDGGTVYSPGAWSQFVHSTKTGRWYWIGNVLPEPSYGNCDPRYPLQIVELDTRTLRLKRGTMTTIQDKEPGDDKWVRFSNFRTYEERGTGDFILLMVKSYCELAPPGLPTPAWRYRIHIN